jgi:hypothetical protein
MGEQPLQQALRASLGATAPPQGLPSPLVALWYAGRGEWDRAHAIVQHESDADSAWVHALLHRQEGDLFNAAYWYRRAGRPSANASIDDEWDAIAAALSVRGQAANRDGDRT